MNLFSTQWPLAAYPDVVDSLFWDATEAQAEVNRRAALRSVKRGIYALTVDIDQVLHVGDVIQLTHPRYGFASGELATVVGVKRRPGQRRQEVEIWR